MCAKTRDWNQCYVDHDTPWGTNRPSDELARILREWSVQPCRVLELGCGTGSNAVYLAEQGFQVTAFDVSPVAIEQSAKRAAAAGVNVEFFTADVLQMDGFAEQFPLVFDRGVYHVVRQDDARKFVAVLASFTSSGGVYLTLAGNANDASPSDGTK